MNDIRRLRRILLDVLPAQDDKIFNAGPRMAGSVELPYYEELHHRLWDRLLKTEEFTDVFNEVKAKHWGTLAVVRIFSDAKYGKGLFHGLTGDVLYPERGWRDPRPYKGMETFLEDRVPRSCPKMFSFILKRAAELTEDQHPDHRYVIHYDCLKQAFTLSAHYKLGLLYEEHPWTKVFLSELKGHKLPMEEMDVLALWSRKFPEGVEKAVEGLNAPAELWLGWGQLLTELEKIEVLERRKKSGGECVIDFPEMHRRSIGMGRKGGVKRKKPEIPDRPFYDCETRTEA